MTDATQRPQAVVGIVLMPEEGVEDDSEALNGSIALVTRRKKDGPGYIGPPGGKVEPGETLFAALARELREEVGIEVLEAHCVWGAPTNTCFTYVFVVTQWRGEMRAREAGETAYWRPSSWLKSSMRSKYWQWYDRMFKTIRPWI